MKVPLYWGTVHSFANTITDSTPSKFHSLSYNGYHTHMYWDARTQYYGWNTKPNYVFDVRGTDGITFQISVNPRDFPDVNEAQRIARKHAIPVFRTPSIFRTWIKTFQINGPGPGSLGGGNSHTKTANVNTGASDGYFASGTMEEWWMHEAAHGTIDPKVYGTAGWARAVRQDNAYISTYAKDYPQREDVAESILAWMFARLYPTDVESRKIIRQIPNRLAFFDGRFPEILQELKLRKPVVRPPPDSSDFVTVECVRDTSSPNRGDFQIQAWWDDGQVNGWQGQTFTGSCRKKNRHTFRVDKGLAAGWIWVKGNSRADSIVKVSSRRNGDWVLDNKPHISISKVVKSCESTRHVMDRRFYHETTCCNGGMGRDRNGFCELSKKN